MAKKVEIHLFGGPMDGKKLKSDYETNIAVHPDVGTYFVINGNVYEVEKDSDDPLIIYAFYKNKKPPEHLFKR